MIVKNQNNLKVHFAGAENLIRSSMILKASKINYTLFTIFPFICDEFGITHGFQNNGETYKEVANFNFENSKHTIQDSGIFSLAFGSYKGEKDENFLMRWYEKLVELSSVNEYKGTIVELDVQKLLGIQKAWDLRKRLKDDLPNNRQINVFHIEDGQKGLDRLIEFSDYIALSIPEIRSLGKKNHVVRLANYVKNKKPSIDIHLLGCTENKLLKALRFCSSCDSTSWLSINRYGWFKFNNGKETISMKKSEISRKLLHDRYQANLLECFKISKHKPTESLSYYHQCELFQLEHTKQQYEFYAGYQN